MRDKRMKRKVAVVGGGASGMMAAISAAGEGAEVTLFEKNDRVGQKILATGNGKCNFSNKVMSADCFYGTGSVQVEKYLQRFGTADTIHFFEQLGMRVKDRNGYLYPASEQASTVLDVLCMELARRKITVKTQSGVKSIRKENEKLEIRTAAKESSLWDAVILTCGGLASPKTGSNGDGLYMARALGHDIVTPVPALTALRCEGDFWKSVAGVRCEAKIDLVVDGETVLGESGELQFTDYGISGIPVFQISREAAYALEARKKVCVRIHLIQDSGADSLFWKERWERWPQETMEEFMTGLLNQKLNRMLLQKTGIRAEEGKSAVPEGKRHKLQELCHCLEVTVNGINPFEQAQVTAGGVNFAEVTQELESRRMAGLYFAGEVLDIDGICGGYNLQWAWTSGRIAGRAAARKEQVQ